LIGLSGQSVIGDQEHEQPAMAFREAAMNGFAVPVGRNQNDGGFVRDPYLRRINVKILDNRID